LRIAWLIETKCIVGGKWEWNDTKATTLSTINGHHSFVKLEMKMGREINKEYY